MVIRAVVLANDVNHALKLAKQIRGCEDGELTTLVDKNRLYCTLQCYIPTYFDDDPAKALAKDILAEISVRDAFEERLVRLGCPFTFIDDSDTDDSLTFEEMKTCDGPDELLTQLFELESLRDILVLHKDTVKYAQAIDALLPYIKKSLFTTGNS